MPSATGLTDFTYEWHHFSVKSEQRGLVCVHVCGSRLFTLKRKGRQTRWRQEKERKPAFRCSLLSLYSIALQNKCIFYCFWSTPHTCAAWACEVVEEEGTFDAPCFSVLTGEASTWWTQSSGSWRWGIKMFLFIETTMLFFLWKVLSESYDVWAFSSGSIF